MIKVRARPRSRVMALRTGLRKTGLHVIRTGRALEIFEVAADARRICGGQGVVAIHVTLRALHRRVRPGQREPGGRVIERRARPRSCVVALRTGLRECGLHVVRIRGSLEILQMATDARGVRGSQVVVAVYMALSALDSRVGPAQRESGGRVIKGRVVPRSCVVALRTGLRETGLHVIRFRRGVEILDVARRAIGGRSYKIAINVALRACHVGVRTGQRKFRKGGVIESRRIPSARVVAGLAGRRETRLCVRRIVRLIEVRHVAAHATCRRLRELAAGVAGIAIQSGVRTHQGEACELQMVELRAHPVVDGVALFASGRHSQRDVIDPRGLGVNEVVLVARVAGGRKALELSYGGALVARVTTHCRVCARERKPVHVLVDLLDRNVPTFHRVALFAVRAHLRLVNVRMALAALCSDIREHRLGVALRARNPFVHSAQRIFCGVVIELWNGANRLPSA